MVNGLAANNDGIWGAEPASFSFEILSPWWTRWWAYTIYALIITSIIIALYRFQFAKKIAEADSQRLKEINQLKTSLYNNITHEFRTPLTVILGMADTLKSKVEKKDWKDTQWVPSR